MMNDLREKAMRDAFEAHIKDFMLSPKLALDYDGYYKDSYIASNYYWWKSCWLHLREKYESIQNQ